MARVNVTFFSVLLMAVVFAGSLSPAQTDPPPATTTQPPPATTEPPPATTTQPPPATTTEPQQAPAPVADNPMPSVPPTDYKPKFRGDPARSEAEFLALGYIRTVVDAQRQYRKKRTKYATSLPALVGSGSFTKRMLRTDRGDYTATFVPQKKGEKYSLQLIPKQLDSTHRAFFVNESGIIRAEEAQPATAQSPVLKPDRS